MSKSNVGQVVFFLASCKVFNSGNVDKNGKTPLILDPISGTSPRGLNVISGTSAELSGFTPGKCYAVKAVESEPYTDDKGNTTRSFNFNSVGEVSTLEAMNQAMSNKPNYLIQPSNVTKEVAEEVEAEA